MSEQALDLDPEMTGPEAVVPETPGAGDEISSEALGLILEVPVTLSMEVGRTRMSIGDLLQLGPGSIVELDRLAGAPMDVLVNGTLIAQGEVVVVNDKFGIRLTEVASARDRVRSAR